MKLRAKLDKPIRKATPTRSVSEGHEGVRPRLRFELVCIFIFLFAGCRQQMASQPSYRPFQASTFFGDGGSARPLVPGTVARGQLLDESLAGTERTDHADERPRYVETFPFPVTRLVLQRGRERFNIYCSVCHDRLGTGQGVVVRRGFIRPPSFHTGESSGLKIPLRDAPVGYYFEVVTNGFAAMPAHAEQISPRDRWAIVAYVRALQLSQHATLDDVPETERDRLVNGEKP